MIRVPVSSVCSVPSSPACADAAMENAHTYAERNDKNSHPKWYCPSEVRLLILDSDAPLCHTVQAALASDNFTVDIVYDPAQLEAVLNTRFYHVIILDYVLPGLGGEQVLDWLRETQPEASIIVVTARPSIDSALYCLRARTYDYLTKPFQLSDLRRTVYRCLEDRGLLRLSEEGLREALGTAIRERRKGLGLTLAQMAQRTGLSLGYLSQIELGKNSASLETLYRISLGLGFRLVDLFQNMQKSAAPTRKVLTGAANAGK